MKQLVEAFLEDLSTKEIFLFRIACAGCGTDYASRPIWFSRAGVVPQTRSKEIIYAAVYEQEYRAARQNAVRDVAEQLNHCPICKRLICNRCFLVCDDLDMCRECAASLEVTGSPVFPEIVEAAAY